jgi:MraZ protein
VANRRSKTDAVDEVSLGAEMPVLVGTHVNKIDRKGRVSVPKQFRDFLQASNSSFVGMYAFPLFNAPAIEGCGEEFLSRITKSVGRLDLFSVEQNDMAKLVLGRTHQLSFDPEGRVVLPSVLLDHAEISGEVLFVGQGERFQIWNSENYEKHLAQAVERAQTSRATLPLAPSGSAGE